MENTFLSHSKLFYIKNSFTQEAHSFHMEKLFLFCMENSFICKPKCFIWKIFSYRKIIHFTWQTISFKNLFIKKIHSFYLDNYFFWKTFSYRKIISKLLLLENLLYKKLIGEQFLLKNILCRKLIGKLFFFLENLFIQKTY